eukprot:1268752-Amphidinium_carterae.1
MQENCCGLAKRCACRHNLTLHDSRFHFTLLPVYFSSYTFLALLASCNSSYIFSTVSIAGEKVSLSTGTTRPILLKSHMVRCFAAAMNR